MNDVNDINKLDSNDVTEKDNVIFSDDEKLNDVSSRNSFYKIDDELTTAKYMKDSFKEKIVIPTHDDTSFNPFVFRHAMTQDMDITTFLMWMQAFSPLLAGILVYNHIPEMIGLGFIGKYIMLCILDALFGLLDVYVLYKHEYDVKNLIIWSVWFPPVYMKLRSKLLGEKNLHHVVWIITTFVLVIM